MLALLLGAALYQGPQLNSTACLLAMQCAGSAPHRKAMPIILHWFFKILHW
jgi:hypothetical protein